MRLTDFKALTFDCYGTLIDWEDRHGRSLKPLTSQAKAPLGRNAILEAHAAMSRSQQVCRPGKDLPRAARDRLQAPRRGMGICRDLVGLPALWPERAVLGRHFPIAQLRSSISRSTTNW